MQNGIGDSNLDEPKPIGEEHPQPAALPAEEPAPPEPKGKRHVAGTLRAVLAVFVSIFIGMAIVFIGFYIPALRAQQQLILDKAALAADLQNVNTRLSAAQAQTDAAEGRIAAAEDAVKKAQGLANLLRAESNLNLARAALAGGTTESALVLQSLDQTLKDLKSLTLENEAAQSLKAILERVGAARTFVVVNPRAGDAAAVELERIFTQLLLLEREFE